MFNGKRALLAHVCWACDGRFLGKGACGGLKLICWVTGHTCLPREDSTAAASAEVTLEPTTCVMSFAREWSALALVAAAAWAAASWLADILGWL